ncbi:MAG: DUF433 domain-containing protein [Syntrophales bacterium LBB04]|nr:DUF433 domain-containing protein [Syntrophales bacterium LBB04]
MGKPLIRGTRITVEPVSDSF